MSNPRFPSALASAWRCAVVLNGSLALLLACLWGVMAWRGLFWKADFGALYTGWSMVLDGQSGRLYDLELQDDYQHRLLSEKPADEGLLPFVYPPHTAATLAPLALLPRSSAFAVWTVMQLGMCVLAGRFLLRLLDGQPSGTPGALPWLTLLTALAFPPLFVSFQMGQVSLWCLVCLLGFVAALKERRPFATALWVVAGTIKPQLMVVAFLVLLGQRRWRELGLAAALLTVWAGLTAALLGPDCWIDFLAVLRFSSRQFGAFGTNPLSMYNLKGLLTGVLGTGRADLVVGLTAAAWLAGGVLTLWLWRGRHSPAEGAGAGRLALTFLVAAIVNPHLFAADALILVLPAVLFFAHLRHHRSGVVFAALAAACPLLFFLDCYWPDPLAVRPFFLLMLGLAGWMTHSLGRPVGQHVLPAPQPA